MAGRQLSREELPMVTSGPGPSKYRKYELQNGVSCSPKVWWVDFPLVWVVFEGPGRYSYLHVSEMGHELSSCWDLLDIGSILEPLSRFPFKIHSQATINFSIVNLEV